MLSTLVDGTQDPDVALRRRSGSKAECYSVWNGSDCSSSSNWFDFRSLASVLLLDTYKDVSIRESQSNHATPVLFIKIPYFLAKAGEASEENFFNKRCAKPESNPETNKLVRPQLYTEAWP